MLRTISFRGRVTIGYAVEGNDVVIVAIAGSGRDMLEAIRDENDADDG